MKELICIICPKGCIITQEGDNVTGYTCKRGRDYAIKELTNPSRVVTSTVKISGAALRRLPVKTNGEVPLKLVKEAVRVLDDVTMVSPVKEGDIVSGNILGTGVAFVATRDM